MKKYVLLIACLFYLVSANAQNEQFYGKWNIHVMTADGMTLAVDKLVEFGLDKNYIEILADGTYKMQDKTDLSNGTWEYFKDENIFKTVLTVSEEDKANGLNSASAKYTVEEISEEFLILKLGKIMTTKYKKE